MNNIFDIEKILVLHNPIYLFVEDFRMAERVILCVGKYNERKIVLLIDIG
jgi:hypothetical protein